MDRLQFMGSTLFIPIFLVSVGILLEPKVMVDPKTLGIALIFTVAVLGGKALAAVIAGRTFRFTWPEVGVMSGLSGSQAAATLATTLVGAKLGLFDKQTINAVLVVILASLVVTPALVSLLRQAGDRRDRGGGGAGKDRAGSGLGRFDPARARAWPGSWRRATGASSWRRASRARKRRRPSRPRSVASRPRRRSGWRRKGSSRARCFASPRPSPKVCSRRSWARRRRCSSTNGTRATGSSRTARQSEALARSPVPTLIAHGDVAHFDRVLIVTHPDNLVRPGRQSLELAAQLAPRFAHGRPIRTVSATSDPVRALFADKKEMDWIEARDPIDWIKRNLAEDRSAVLRGARGSRRSDPARSGARRRALSGGAGGARGDDLSQARGAGGRPGRRRAKPQASPRLTRFRPPHPKFAATFAARFTDACNRHVPDREEDSAGRSSVPPARGGRAGTGPHAGGRRLRDRSRDRALRVRRPAPRRAVPGDGPRVARRGRRGRQRGVEPQARRSGGHDGAPPLRQPRVPPLPPQPAGLLRAPALTPSAASCGGTAS